MEIILVGCESFKYLGWSFLNTVLWNSHNETPEVSMVAKQQENQVAANNICCQSWASCDEGFYLGIPSLWVADMNDITSSSLNGTKHSCYGSDWIVVLIQFTICHTYSWGVRWFVIEPWVRWKLGPNCATRKRQEKFSQNLVALSLHVLSGYFAWRIISRKPWFTYWDPYQWFVHDTEINFDANNPQDTAAAATTTTTIKTKMIDADFKFYYLLYAARYISDLISLGYEHQRSDTWAYRVHHVATIVLVFMSAQAGLARVGGILMSFFDWADPPMLIAKAFRYLSRHPQDWYQFMADRFFELFAIGFIVTRNVLYTYIAWQIIIHVPNNIMDDDNNSNHEEDTNDGSELAGVTTILILKGFLVVLVLLMKFWLWLIIRSAYHQLTNNGNIDDIRSDSENGDEEETRCHRQQPIAQKRKNA